MEIKSLHTSRYHAKVFKELLGAVNRAAVLIGLDEFEDNTRLQDLIDKVDLTKIEITEIGTLVKELFGSPELVKFLQVFAEDQDKKEILTQEVVKTLGEIKLKLVEKTFV